jgi:hypothetical protein
MTSSEANDNKTPVWDCGIVKVDGFRALVELNENELSRARKAFELSQQSPGGNLES